GVGLHVGGGAAVVVQGSLVESATARGIDVDDGAIVLEHSELRDTQPDGAGNEGFGVAGGESTSSVTVRGSLLARNRHATVVGFGAQVEVDASVVRDTLPRESDGCCGIAVGVRPDLDV